MDNYQNRWRGLKGIRECFYFDFERVTAATPPGEEGAKTGLLVVVVVSVVLAVV